MNEDGQTDDVNVTSLDTDEGGAPNVDDNQDVVTSSNTEKKLEPVKLKTKPIPAVITLLGGCLVTVSVFLQQLEFKQSLIMILIGLLLCLIIGEMAKLLLDKIELPNPKAVDHDGNVIQKGKSGDSEEGAEGEDIPSLEAGASDQ
ncbi:MAG: hypothetical protein IJU43_02070 [Lachnospiraceae bacterium]|nr:hypothetical protein [Lachnospiraceae bacterium]